MARTASEAAILRRTNVIEGEICLRSATSKLTKRSGPAGWAGPLEHSAKGGSGRGLRLRDLFLHLERARGEVVVLRLGEERVEPAPGIDRAQRRRGDAEFEGAAQRLGHERHIVQIREKPASGLVVGVADIVANHRTLSGQFAAARHGFILVSSLGTGAARPVSTRAGTGVRRMPRNSSAGFRRRVGPRQAPNERRASHTHETPGLRWAGGWGATGPEGTYAVP